MDHRHGQTRPDTVRMVRVRKEHLNRWLAIICFDRIRFNGIIFSESFSHG